MQKQFSCDRYLSFFPASEWRVAVRSGRSYEPGVQSEIQSADRLLLSKYLSGFERDYPVKESPKRCRCFVGARFGRDQAYLLHNEGPDVLVDVGSFSGGIFA